MNISTSKCQQMADYAIRRYKKAKKDTYVGEKLTALVNIEGFGNVDRIYTCTGTYPYFAQFSYDTKSGVTLYECFDYGGIQYIRENHRVSNQWVRDYDAS